MANQGIANDLAGMIGVTGSAGSTASPNNSGKGPTPQSGVVRSAGNQRAPVVTPMPALRQARAQTPPARHPPPPHPMQRPQFSANNPPLGTQAPPIPHPGLIPPYPDARSAQPTLTPNGVPIFPAPPNVMGVGMNPMGPRVPPTFTPGMTGLLGR